MRVEKKQKSVVQESPSEETATATREWFHAKGPWGTNSLCLDEGDPKLKMGDRIEFKTALLIVTNTNPVAIWIPGEVDYGVASLWGMKVKEGAMGIIRRGPE